MVKSSIFYLLATVFQAGSSLLFLPVQRHFLGLADAGTIIWIVSLVTLIGTFGNLGVSESVLYKVKSESLTFQETRRLTLFSILPSGVLSAVSITTSLALFLIFDQHYFLYLAIASISIPAVAVIALNLAILRATVRPALFALQTAFWMLGAPLMGVLSFELSNNPSTDMYLCFWVVGIFVSAFIGILLTKFKISKSNSSLNQLSTKSQFFSMSKAGFPLLLHSSTATIVANVDRVVLAAMVGAQEVAIFQVIYLLGLAPSVVLGTVNGAWALKFFGSNKSGSHWSEIKKEAVNITALSYSLIGGIFIIALPIMNIMLSHEIVRTIPNEYLVALGFVGLIQVPYFMASNALYQAGENKQIALVTIPNLLVQSLGSVILIPTLGIAGPIIAICVFQAIQSARIWNIAKKKSGLLPLPGAWFVSAIIALLMLLLSVYFPTIQLFQFGIVCLGISIVLFFSANLKRMSIPFIR